MASVAGWNRSVNDPTPPDVYARINPVCSFQVRKYSAEYVNNQNVYRWTVEAYGPHILSMVAVADFDNEQDALDYVDNDPQNLLG